MRTSAPLLNFCFLSWGRSKMTWFVQGSGPRIFWHFWPSKAKTYATAKCGNSGSNKTWRGLNSSNHIYTLPSRRSSVLLFLKEKFYVRLNTRYFFLDLVYVQRNHAAGLRHKYVCTRTGSPCHGRRRQSLSLLHIYLPGLACCLKLFKDRFCHCRQGPALGLGLQFFMCTRIE